MIATYDTINETQKAIVDNMVRTNTAFGTLEDMLQAKGNYRPSLDVSEHDRRMLADLYDATQEARGDDRRAFRYGQPRPAPKPIIVKTRKQREAEEAEDRRNGKLFDRIYQAKKDAHAAHSAPYTKSSGLCLVCADERGELIDDKSWVDRVSIKSIVAFIQSFEPDFKPGDTPKHTYYVDGDVDGADNCRQYMMRYEDNDWDDAGWIHAREDWSVEIKPEDLTRKRKK